jgi:hypothetical protein
LSEQFWLSFVVLGELSVIPSIAMSNPPFNPNDPRNASESLLPSFSQVIPNLVMSGGQLEYNPNPPASSSLLGGFNLQPVSSFGSGINPAGGVMPPPPQFNSMGVLSSGMNQPLFASFPQSATPLNALAGEAAPYNTFGAQSNMQTLLPTIPPMPVMPDAAKVQRDTERQFVRELEIKVECWKANM